MLIFADEGGRGGDPVMLTSSCHFVKKAKKIKALRAFLLSFFFCIRQKNIEKSEINKENLNIFYSFQKFFKICPSFSEKLFTFDFYCEHPARDP